MKHRYIGKTGLRVSPLCMGTMTFGSFCDERESFAIMDKAYEAGVNFFDTAELYPVPPRASWAGRTEEIVGRWLKGRPRDSVILATKVAGAASGWFVPPIRHGLTAIDRFHIERAVEGSLKRLGTDYIDLYQMHWPDTVVPIEESLEAFDRLVGSGKVRYIGTSNDTAYGLTKANEASRYLKLARFESIQNNFSLLNRRFLDELATVCRQEKISLLPYAPLAGGVLTGKYNGEFFPPEARFTRYLQDKNPRVRAQAARYLNDRTLEATALYKEIADAAGMSLTTLAVAWSIHHDFVASSIIGATRAEQLDETLAAMNVTLDDEVLAACDGVHEAILYPMG
ncbi:aldo/keto reductase [Hydrogenimonas sp.]